MHFVGKWTDSNVTFSKNGSLGEIRNAILGGVCLICQAEEICIRALLFNSYPPEQNGRQYADESFKRIFVNDTDFISIKKSLKFIPKGPVNNKVAFVQVRTLHRTGDKPLPEPMLTKFTDAYMRH